MIKEKHRQGKEIPNTPLLQTKAISVTGIG